MQETNVMTVFSKEILAPHSYSCMKRHRVESSNVNVVLDFKNSFLSETCVEFKKKEAMKLLCTDAFWQIP